MDDDVLAAVARWPNVPAVYGWLSLDPRGRWRLHPRGDARPGNAGEAISNPAILAFMSRNYGNDDAGRWFFQNGPQRVFVQLDAAPFILRIADDQRGLVTHTGLVVERIDRWLMDETGRLYAATNRGGGLVEDRDLAGVLDRLAMPDGTPLIDCLEAGMPVEVVGSSGGSVEAVGSAEIESDALAPFIAQLSYRDVPTYAAPLSMIRYRDLEHHLGFVATPTSPP